jgi:Outer membrane protein beta-barrel domain
MRRFVTGLAAALLTIVPAAAAAQALGAKGGVTFTNIVTAPPDAFGIDSSAQPGVLGGGYVVFGQTARFSVQVDGLFALKRIGFDVSDYELTMVDVPVVVRWSVAKYSRGIVRAIGGVNISTLLQAREKVVNNDPFDIKVAFESVAMAAIVGGQFEWKERFLFDGRYSFGLTEVYSAPLPDIQARYRGFDVTVGYRFK